VTKECSHATHQTLRIQNERNEIISTVQGPRPEAAHNGQRGEREREKQAKRGEMRLSEQPVERRVQTLRMDTDGRDAPARADEF
jgi:hypothetical protein